MYIRQGGLVSTILTNTLNHGHLGNKRSLFWDPNRHSLLVTQILLDGVLWDSNCVTEVSNFHHKLKILDHATGLRMTRLLVISICKLPILKSNRVCRRQCDQLLDFYSHEKNCSGWKDLTVMMISLFEPPKDKLLFQFLLYCQSVQ